MRPIRLHLIRSTEFNRGVMTYRVIIPKALAADGVTWVRYEYDAANRLQAVKKDDAGQTLLQAFQFGSTNARLIDYDPAQGLNKFYASVGGQTLAEYTEYSQNVPTWTKSYTYLGDSQLSTVTPNGTGGEYTEYNHPDRLGTKLVTNNAANTSFEQSTLPFGTALNVESSGFSNQVFTSYERSSTTSLDYAVNRTYSPGQGRFTTVDPIGMASTSLRKPQSLNLFAYVQNSPIDLTDPSGLDEISAAVSLAQELLQFAPCKSLFRRGSNPAQFLGNAFRTGKIRPSTSIPIFKGIGPRRFALRDSRPFNNDVAVTVDSTYTTHPGRTTRTVVGIYIDINGQFFNPPYPVFGLYEGSQIYIKSSEHNALTLIHELAHWMNNAPGGEGHSIRLNQAIYVRCFLLNPDWRRQREPLEPGSTEIETQISTPPLIPLPVQPGTMGGYPSWYWALQAFLAEIDAIEVGGGNIEDSGGTVTVGACVGSDCKN